MMMKRVSLLLLFVFSPLLAWASNCDGAGNCYVYASATGSGNGSSWTNACTGFTGTCAPSSMTRGVTYWVAAGSYGGVNFNTPVSGTSVVTVQAPTTSNHGPASDWNSSFAGQAVFSESAISTSYWTFNGQTRGSDWQSGYLLKFWNQTDGSGAALNLPNTTTNITLEYVELEGTGAGFPNNISTRDQCNTDNCGVWGDVAIFATPAANNFYAGYCYLHNTGNEQVSMNQGVSNTSTWEYNWFAYNHTGQNGLHDEAYSILANNLTIRYSVFQDISGSGQITTASASESSISNWAIYGNLFFWDPTYNALNGAYQEATNANSILDFLGENLSGYVYFYDNTIAGMYNSSMLASGVGASTMAIGGQNGTYSLGNPTVVVENNLWYGCGWVYGDYTPYCSANVNAVCTYDYNASYQGGIGSGYDWQTQATPAAHDYNVSGSSSPFVNFSAATIAGLQLVTPDPFASHAGISLASPYNFDGFNQVTRGANGTWDRGAEQIGAATSPPAPPTGLTATPH